jgi:hypothetical protein
VLDAVLLLMHQQEGGDADQGEAPGAGVGLGAGHVDPDGAVDDAVARLAGLRLGQVVVEAVVADLDLEWAGLVEPVPL